CQIAPTVATRMDAKRSSAEHAKPLKEDAEPVQVRLIPVFNVGCLRKKRWREEDHCLPPSGPQIQHERRLCQLTDDVTHPKDETRTRLTARFQAAAGTSFRHRRTSVPMTSVRHQLHVVTTRTGPSRPSQGAKNRPHHAHSH